MKSRVYFTEFTDYKTNLKQLFKVAKIEKEIKKQKLIIIKPNLTTALPKPCTTSVELIKELIKLIQVNSKARIIIAEGSGGCKTIKAFKKLGYESLKELNIELIDLNKEKRIKLLNENALKLKKIKLPKILFEEPYLINVPVLKEHDEAIITNGMKNLIGCYLSRGLLKFHSWNKGELHLLGLHECINDLNLFIKSNLIISDASIGQKGNEIHGIPCKPPLKKLLLSKDVVAIDSFASKLLGHEWNKIKYLNYANNIIGKTEYKLIKVN